MTTQETRSTLPVSLEVRSVLVGDYPYKPFHSVPIRRGEYWVHCHEGEKGNQHNIYKIYPITIERNQLSVDAYLNNSDEAVVHLKDIHLGYLGHDIEAKLLKEADEVYAAAVKFAQEKAVELGVRFENCVRMKEEKD